MRLSFFSIQIECFAGILNDARFLGNNFVNDYVKPIFVPQNFNDFFRKKNG
jgi:hypothetical protein